MKLAKMLGLATSANTFDLRPIGRTAQPRLLRRAREDRQHAAVVAARRFERIFLIGAIDHIHHLVGGQGDDGAGFDDGAVRFGGTIPQARLNGQWTVDSGTLHIKEARGYREGS